MKTIRTFFFLMCAFALPCCFASSSDMNQDENVISASDNGLDYPSSDEKLSKQPIDADFELTAEDGAEDDLVSGDDDDMV